MPIDHSTLSPSGKNPNRSKKAALERNRRALFGDDLPYPTVKQPSKAEKMFRQADQLSELAARGMKPRAYHKKAANLREEASDLIENGQDWCLQCEAVVETEGRLQADGLICVCADCGTETLFS